MQVGTYVRRCGFGGGFALSYPPPTWPLLESAVVCDDCHCIASNLPFWRRPPPYSYPILTRTLGFGRCYMKKKRSTVISGVTLVPCLAVGLSDGGKSYPSGLGRAPVDRKSKREKKKDEGWLRFATSRFVHDKREGRQASAKQKEAKLTKHLSNRIKRVKRPMHPLHIICSMRRRLADLDKEEFARGD